MNRRTLSILVILFLAAGATPSSAQTPASDPDLDLSMSQPDFTLVGLPTNLRVPKFRSAFRVTHRFTRPLGDGSFSDLASDFFGLDTGAQIGLEYRFGILSKTQIGIHRTSNRTIEFFGQREVLAQGEGFPLTVSALFTVDGTDNFTDRYSPALGSVISRTIGEYAALYLEPVWVNNSNVLPSDLVDENDTFLVGLAARVRVRPTLYLVFEGSPRVSGYKPGEGQMSFALEKRAGGHMFQMNISNAIGTTFGQISHGGLSNDDWFIGFNISRKFF